MDSARSHALALTALAALLTPMPARAGPVADRIGHSDPSRFRSASGVHGGAGSMAFAPLLGAHALSTNLIFVHRGEIAPKSGIGQHFHNQCEEMFVILDGDAEFTIDGRTSTIAGPAAVPDRMGHAHAIYNPGDRPIQWLNVNVGMTKNYDNFDLGDPRVGVPLDPVPQFISMRLDRALLRPTQRMDGGQGTVLYRRALGPAVFATPWSFVDHLVLPPGTSVGAASTPGMSAVYYVVAGEGEMTIANETVRVRAGDAVPVEVGERRAIRQIGGQPIEFMVIGIARDLAAKAAFAEAAAPRPK
ncbi:MULTISPECIES: cupin domain-containing protein [unclassified Sphingomonas]|uniref:cupin domain-containing protein n=1 Tax=unclassified Sphingomonas TaxID=196159 RepID=UPI000B15122B|nr:MULTISPECIES: cupin domain-containing protein [unclassified Sphingomonas]